VISCHEAVVLSQLCYLHHSKKRKYLQNFKTVTASNVEIVTVPGKQDWLAPLIISCFILVTPLWVWIAKNNEHTREVLYTGWTPVMAAMLISR
jgi:hypothetical protein